MKSILAVALFLVGLALVIFFHQHWIAVHTGLIHAGPDPYYNFWSGFGSDLGYVTIFASAIVAYRHRNCHRKWCLRLGKPIEGSPYLACHKHHKGHQGTRRSVSQEVLDAAHDNRRR